MDSTKSKIKPYYGRSKRANALTPCNKHPKHRQSPGVCSLCLNEKLSQLTNHNCSKPKTQLSSSSSSYDLSSLSSSNASSYSSPVVFDYRRSSTRASRKIVSGQEMFKKSSSMDFVFRRKKERDGDDDDQSGKKVEMRRGFWWKLMFLRRGNYMSKGLLHSRTTRERGITAVH